jgi:hypothetical protein
MITYEWAQTAIVTLTAATAVALLVRRSVVRKKKQMQTGPGCVSCAVSNSAARRPQRLR